MGPWGLLMPTLFLAPTKGKSIYKTQEVVKYPLNLTTIYYNKVNLQEHCEVSLSIPLEI